MSRTQRNSPNTINIRRGELHRQRRELEERLRPLRAQLIALINEEELARNRETEDWHRLQLASNLAFNPLPKINTDLRQSSLAHAYREEVRKVQQHYENNTTTSDAFERDSARRTKLQIRMNKRRNQALATLVEEKEKAQHAYDYSRDTLTLTTAARTDLELEIRELDTALSAVVDEEARLNRGRGRKRKLHATQKTGKRSKNTRKRRL
jgi:hypothetical protein